MELKHWSWLIVCFCILLNILGIRWLFLLLITIVFFIVGILSIIYLKHRGEENHLSHDFSENSMFNNDPLVKTKLLGLNLAIDQKPVILLSPNIRVQTISPSKSKTIIATDARKKSLIDSGIEMFFKKNPKQSISDHLTPNVLHKFNTEVTSVPISTLHGDGGGGDGGNDNGRDKDATDDGHKWKFFETIKIHTDKRHGNDPKKEVQMAEECSASHRIEVAPMYKLHNDSAVLDQHGSPKKKLKTMLSGYKQIDQMLHTIIDYILRDFIDSWFYSLTDNKEFSEFRTRNCIEDSIQNISNRIKNIQWVPLITTKLVDNVAMHARFYRLASEKAKLSQEDGAKRSEHKSGQNTQVNLSPQRFPVTANRGKLQQKHRRNKSDTDLSWYATNQRTVGNSKFYEAEEPPAPERPKPCDHETKLVNAFFDQCDLYRDECLDEKTLEDYLTHCMETVLYFTLPEEDFTCVPLRTFLSTLLANVVCKPIIDMLSEPDVINLQVAKLLKKELPSSEVFLKLLRQCNDLAELRACRQLIIREMDSKHRDANATAELSSLKYTQKLIDLRISILQNNRSETAGEQRPMSNLPILSLDELLNVELALSYYLDYLSVMNLQKYVIFYLMAREWKATTIQCLDELRSNKLKSVREDALKVLRDKANNIYKEYLSPTSTNLLNIDAGLIEALNIRLNDTTISPDVSWFESICKYVYEKIKNEDVFLNNFYQSTAYRKLLLELEFCGNMNVDTELDSHLTSTNLSQTDTGSDSNSGDLPFDDEIDFVLDSTIVPMAPFTSASIAAAAVNMAKVPIKTNATLKSPSSVHQSKAMDATKSDKNCESPSKRSQNSNLLTVTTTAATKHARSQSDCTGLVQSIQQDIRVEPFSNVAIDPLGALSPHQPNNEMASPNPSDRLTPIHRVASSVSTEVEACHQQRVSAKIINTAINCEGQFAVYAIHVTVVENNQQESWHIYRRYSKFLELKKALVKRYPSIAQVPFPAKKTFQNTQRSVLEHRMEVLNEFLRIVCNQAHDNDDLHTILRDFLEPDTNDKKISGGSVIRTIETIVNPLKSGMRTIKNMPDTLVGGVAKILLGRGAAKETAFLQDTPIQLDHSSEYPALTSALNLLDEVFDLQARSQWLRRGLINRLLGAPWVSQAANKRIAQSVKTAIEVEKIEKLLATVLNTIWPDGKRCNQSIPREENTKLRTRLAAKIALFALLSDELKHVVGSETTRIGLLNCFSMWQHKALNMRLILVLFSEILKALYQTNDLTKHIK